MSRHAKNKREDMAEPAVKIEKPTFWQALAEPSKLIEYDRYKKQLLADAVEKLAAAEKLEKDGKCSQAEIDAAYDVAEQATAKAAEYSR